MFFWRTVRSRGRVTCHFSILVCYGASFQEGLRNMDKRQAYACLLAFLFFAPLSMSIPVVEAESLSSSVVKIVSPTSATYDRRVLLLNVTFSYGGLRYDLTYDLDGVVEGSIPIGEYRLPNNEFHLINTVFAWVTLPELSDGPHSVTVTLVARVYYSGGGKPSAVFQPTSPGSSEYSATWQDTVRFSVCTDDPYESQSQPVVDRTPPEISNLSVYNQTYPPSDVPLNFSLNGSVSCIAYSLDGAENVTVEGNTTLHGIPVGLHNLTVYAWDSASNVGTSKMVSFTVAIPEQKKDVFPSVPVAAVSVTVAVVVAAIGLHYFKKRKRGQLT
jgi:hypothetical protein